MREAYMISTDALAIIQDFIRALSVTEDLHSKTLKEYSGDLKHFINWFEAVTNTSQNNQIIFRPEDVAATMLTQYRETTQKVMELKPATINRRLTTLKRFFEWATTQNVIDCDPSKLVKLVPEEKVRPRQMTDNEEAELITSVEHYGTLRDQTILILMLNTGLCTMEVCDLIPGDIIIGNHNGQITVRSGKRNKKREVPLNPTIRAVLEKYLVELPSDCPFLFPSEKTGERLCERALRYIVQKYVNYARLDKLSANDLRHRYGYVMAEHTPIHQLAEIMGHDSLDTTMIYVRTNSAKSIKF